MGERKMVGNSSMSRENKKKQLKRQIVPSNTTSREEEDSRFAIKNAHRRTVKRRLIIFLVLTVMVSVGVFAFIQYNRYQSFTEYQVMWEKSFLDESQEAAAQGEGSFCGFVDYGDGVLKYSKDGATYLDAQGKVVWIQSYEMKSPLVSVNGDFIAIADQQGSSIYICDKSGLQGKATTLLPILGVTVSSKGVVAALQEDSKASYIYLYKKDGKDLDIQVKSLLSGDGYPVDISLSPEGRQLIASYMYLDQGMLKCKIVFYNFGLGKNDPRRVVGIFFPPDLEDAMAGRVRFLDESHAAVFTDKGVLLFSTRVETSPELVGQIAVEQNIRSISYTEDKIGIVADNVEGGDPYILMVYDKDGSRIFETTFNYQYTGFDIDKDLALLYNDSSCKVYNMSGTEKFNGTFDFTVSKVSAGRFPGTLLAMGPQVMKEIKLQ